MVDVLDDTRQDATGWVSAPPPAPKDRRRGRLRRRDGGRQDSGGGNGGGGHTAKARREGTFDARNSWQVIAGSILIPLGVVLIMVGWYGAAHANVVQHEYDHLEGILFPMRITDFSTFGFNEELDHYPPQLERAA